MKTLLGVLIVVVLLTLPAAAVGEDGVVVQTPGTLVNLTLRGSHGYEILVTNRGARGRVVLSARKGLARAVYSVHGRVTGDRIEGNFGALGRISLRFQPSRQEPERHRVQKGCRGKPTTVQAGRFVGTIHFEGEEGFSSVAATSAPGTVTSRHTIVCSEFKRPQSGAARQSSGKKSSTLIFKDFLAVAVDHQHSVYLETVNATYSDEQPPDGFTLGEVAMVEHRGRIAIGRSAEIVTEVDPVQASPLGATPVTATIVPQAPIEGTGTYVETPGAATSWSGDLSVHLPGGGVTALTGPEFTAILCHGPAFGKKMNSCRDRLDDLLFRGSRYPLV